MASPARLGTDTPPRSASGTRLDGLSVDTSNGQCFVVGLCIAVGLCVVVGPVCRSGACVL